MTTTTERVVEILTKEGGYRELPRPLKVGALSFEFTHALLAGERATDLVIVIELKGDTVDENVTRRILALTRAMDVLRSRRSVTAVLTSGQAAPDMVHSLSRVCRVLPIGAPSGPGADDAVRDWLSVLLPLKGPDAVDEELNWRADVEKHIPRIAAEPFVIELLEAAAQGPVAVEQTFAKGIRERVAPTLAEDEDEA